MFSVIQYSARIPDATSGSATLATTVGENLGSGPPDTTRKILPRRGLPTGRAVVGALLVAGAAVAAFVLATSGATVPDTNYLVVARPVAAGTTLRLDDVTAEALELTPVVSGAALTGTAGIEGATALRDLNVGELLAADDLVAAAVIDGEPLGAIHELSFPVDRERAATNLVRGDRVTILTTQLRTDSPTTLVAIEDAVVLAWDSHDEGLGTSGTAVLTLALDDAASVVELTHLSQQGPITVVRSTRALDDDYPLSYPAEGDEPGRDDTPVEADHDQ